MTLLGQRRGASFELGNASLMPYSKLATLASPESLSNAGRRGLLWSVQANIMFLQEKSTSFKLNISTSTDVHIFAISAANTSAGNSVSPTLSSEIPTTSDKIIPPDEL